MKLPTLSYLSLLIVVFSFLSCGGDPNPEPVRPDNILNEEEFTKLLTDMALAESAVTLNIKNVAIPRLDTVYAFNPLKEHKVDKAVYDSTIAFYSKHPSLYKIVYENVLASLSEMQTVRESLRKDSAKK